MKIAHIDTERGWRGGQQQVLSLIEGLHRRGWQSVAVVRAGEELARRLDGLVPVVPVSPWSEWSPCVAVALRARLLRDGVDVVHAHTGHAVALAALSTVSTSIPSVATRRVDFRIGRNPLSRWKYRRQRRIVAISNGVKRVLLDDGIPESRIDVVPSGIDFRRFENVPEIPRQQLGVPKDAIVVGQVAALAPHKDQENFLRAVAQLKPRHPNLRAVLVGDGELRKQLESTAASLGLGDVVRFLGYREDALACLKRFDVFCLSSWGEGLGTSIIDAMALGVPVAATQVGGIPELVQEGRTGFLAPARDPGALAQAIEKALYSPNRREVVVRAKELAARYSIDRTVEAMEKIYRSLSA